MICKHAKLQCFILKIQFSDSVDISVKPEGTSVIKDKILTLESIVHEDKEWHLGTGVIKPQTQNYQVKNYSNAGNFTKFKTNRHIDISK